MIVKRRNYFLSKIFNLSQKLQFFFSFFSLQCIIAYLATYGQEINIYNPCKGVKYRNPIFYPDSGQLLNVYVLVCVRRAYEHEHRQRCWSSCVAIYLCPQMQEALRQGVGGD